MSDLLQVSIEYSYSVVNEAEANDIVTKFVEYDEPDGIFNKDNYEAICMIGDDDSIKLHIRTTFDSVH
jgi:hypothetical protein